VIFGKRENPDVLEGEFKCCPACVGSTFFVSHEPRHHGAAGRLQPHAGHRLFEISHVFAL
jgi:hypothetical protein